MTVKRLMANALTPKPKIKGSECLILIINHSDPLIFLGADAHGYSWVAAIIIEGGDLLKIEVLQ